MESTKKVKEAKLEIGEVLVKDDLSIEEIMSARKEMLTAIKLRRPVEKTLAELEESKKKRFSSQAKATARKGIICWMLDKTAEAIKYLEEGSSAESAGYFLGLCYAETGQNAKAHKLFTEAHKEFPNSKYVFDSYIDTLINTGQLDEASALLQKMKDKFRKEPLIPYYRGVYLENTGDYEKAQEEYQHALKLNAEYSPALFRLAYRFNLSGRSDEALELYERLRLIKPPHTNTLINLGLLYEDNGDYEKALECYNTVLNINPNHPRALLFSEDVGNSSAMFYDDSFKRKEQELKRLLSQSISEFQIPTRAQNCLEQLNITTIGDLVKKTEEDLLGCENFGRKTLTDIKELLARRGLTLSTQTRTVTVDTLLKSYISTEEPQRSDDALNKPIFEIDWSARVRGSLTRLKVYTVADLVNKAEKDFMDLPNFGQKSLDEIKRRLSQMGLSLRQSD